MVTKAPRYSEGGAIRLTGGNLDTLRGELRWAGGLGGDWYAKVQGSYTESEDFSLSRDETVEYEGLPQEAIPLVLQENEIAAGSVRLDKYFSGNVLTLEGGTAQYEGPIAVTGIGRVQNTDTERPWARLNFNTPHFNVLAAYTSRDANDQRSLSSGVPLFLDSDRFNVEVQANTALGGDKGQIVGGLSYTEEDVDSANPLGIQTLMFEGRSEDFQAAFLQFEYDLASNLKLVLAGRYDDSSLHDSRFSPKGSLVYSINTNNTLRFTYNEAFQVPNYSEFFLQVNVAPPSTQLAPLQGLFCSPFGVDCGLDVVPVKAVGNNTLEVEEISSWEVGYSGILGRKVFLTVDYYNNEIDNFITDLINFIDPTIGRINPNFGPYQAPEALPAEAAAGLEGLVAQLVPILSNNLDGSPLLIPVSYTNFGQVDTQGVDVGINYYINNAFLLDLNYSWFDFDVGRQLDADPVVPNSAENKVSLGLTYNGRAVSAAVKYRWVDDFLWNAGIFRGPVPSYSVLDLSASYRFGDHWEIGANVSNVLDEEDYQIFGGDLLGIRSLASLTFRW